MIDDDLRDADQRFAGRDIEDGGAEPEHEEDRHAGGEQAEEQHQEQDDHHGWRASTPRWIPLLPERGRSARVARREGGTLFAFMLLTPTPTLPFSGGGSCSLHGERTSTAIATLLKSNFITRYSSGNVRAPPAPCSCSGICPTVMVVGIKGEEIAIEPDQ